MKRFFTFKKAVSSKNYSSFLNIEKSGVYNSLSNINKNQNYYKKEKCEVVSINSCIERVVKQYGKIDMIKIDTFDKKNNFFSARRSLKLNLNDYGRNISIIMIN